MDLAKEFLELLKEIEGIDEVVVLKCVILPLAM